MMGAYGWGGVTPHMFGGTGLFGGWGVIVMGLGLLVVVGLVVWMLVSQRGASSGSGVHAAPYVGTQVPSVPVADGAEAIVRQRFARGEIDRDEYDRTVAALRATL